MVGDSLTSDIAGGRDFGIDTCWLNRAALPRSCDVEPTFEVARLHELLEIVTAVGAG